MTREPNEAESKAAEKEAEDFIAQKLAKDVERQRKAEKPVEGLDWLWKMMETD